MPPIVLVSNRGPLSWRRDEGGALVAKRGGGGLVSGLAPIVAGTDAQWIASALSDDDRAAAAEGIDEAEGLYCRLVPHPPAEFRMAYDAVGNAVLWFVHHGLFELARRPRFDRRFAEAWDGYVAFNARFAEAVVERAPAGAVVLVQDYHLALLAPLVRRARPDVRLVHFSHTPFAGPDWLSVLPDPYRAQLLAGMAANDACGFHTERWRQSFRASCAAFGVAAPTTAVTPLGPDADDLEQVASGEACAAARERLRAEVGDRRLLVRVDRIELSKNLLRGFHAYDDLLEYHPEWRGQVVFAAFVYPSREGLPEYLAYRQEIELLAARINGRWGGPDWTPVVLDTDDDFPRSVAALSLYDVLLVNPLRDGMNLVAKEGPLVNERDGVLVLSSEAGAWDELVDGALGVHPYDVVGTSEALHQALTLEPSERARRAKLLAGAVRRRGPKEWLADQLALAGA
jgi:trehalose 6-phosphate synthase